MGWTRKRTVNDSGIRIHSELYLAYHYRHLAEVTLLLCRPTFRNIIRKWIVAADATAAASGGELGRRASEFWAQWARFKSSSSRSLPECCRVT